MSRIIRPDGASLIVLAGLLGSAAALYDYFSLATGIDHTGGVALVLTSCLLLVLAAIIVLAMRPGGPTGILLFLILLDILGTGAAAWFLESGMLMAAMLLAAIGLTLRLAKRGMAQ